MSAYYTSTKKGMHFTTPFLPRSFVLQGLRVIGCNLVALDLILDSLHFRCHYMRIAVICETFDMLFLRCASGQSRSAIFTYSCIVVTCLEGVS